VLSHSTRVRLNRVQSHLQFPERDSPV